MKRAAKVQITEVPRNLRQWVALTLLPIYGTDTRLAQMLGISQSGLTRGLNLGTMSVENLFKLAELAGEAPHVLLRIAKKPAYADYLERVYTGTVPDEHHALIARFSRLSPKARATLLEMMDQLRV